MALPRYLLLFLFLHCCFARSAAQSSGIAINSDPVLVNGKIYVFHLPASTEGNQYLSGTEFVTGTLTLKGITYMGLQLNYDIYNQQLILKYKSMTGSGNRIIVSDAWMERFSMNSKDFIVIRKNGVKTIYQVFGDGKYQVLYHWTRKLELSHFHGATNSVFSKPRRVMYLFHDNSIFEFRNNKGFIALFDKGEGEKIRSYLQRNGISLREAADPTIAELVSFANASAR
ncbi:MAG TPA: hypothetical protein VK155_04945 [Bacteroidales bacterium]|jgi:hypothetical protein|nr:hypothetical protein [Bacteroidales bacterium]